MRTSIITLLFSFSLIFTAQADTITNNKQISCSQKKPCLISPSSKKIKPIMVSFSEKIENGKKSIFSIRFSYPKGKLQNHTLKSMENLNSDDPYEFRYADLDGDQNKDLALKAFTGTRINHYHYWIYSRKTYTYLYLGLHEAISYDKKHKKLLSLRRGSSEKTRAFKVSSKGKIEPLP